MSFDPNPDGDPVATVPDASADSAKLKADDNVEFCFGHKYLDGNRPVPAISNVAVSIIFGRVSGATQTAASPFSGGASGPKCLFTGSYQDPPVGSGQPDGSGMRKETGHYTDDGKNYLVDWYILPAGIISTNGKFEFMIGANVTTSNSTTYSFGHDPEVDVGM